MSKRWASGLQDEDPTESMWYKLTGLVDSEPVQKFISASNSVGDFINIWGKETTMTAATEIPSSALNSLPGQVAGTSFGMAVTASSPDGLEGVAQIKPFMDGEEITIFCIENAGTVECDELRANHYKKQTKIQKSFGNQ